MHLRRLKWTPQSAADPFDGWNDQTGYKEALRRFQRELAEQLERSRRLEGEERKKHGKKK